MTKLWLFYEAVVNACRVLKRRRERREAALSAASARQFELLDLALRGVVEAIREQNKPLLAALAGQKASTDLIAEWLKSFQLAPGADAAVTYPTPAAKPPQLEWAEEIAAGLGEDIPAEFRLALSLQKMEQGDSHFDREGSDFPE